LFAQALAIIPHLSLNGLSKMVYDHLSEFFILEDPPQIFGIIQAIIVVAHNDIPRLMGLVLGFSRLLVMAKDIGGFHPIVISKVFRQLINHSIIL